MYYELKMSLESKIVGFEIEGVAIGTIYLEDNVGLTFVIMRPL